MFSLSFSGFYFETFPASSSTFVEINKKTKMEIFRINYVKQAFGPS